MSAMLALDPRVCVLHAVSIDRYHAGPGISKSGLDDIARSPATWYARHLDPNRPPERERAGQLEGNLAHCAILEPDEFAKRYVTIPADAPRRPTEAQWNAAKPSPSSVAAMEWWRDFNARTNGATVIGFEQHQTALAQARSVRALPEVAEAMARGAPEQSAYWVDEATGALCRCRPDWVHECGDAGVVLLDVKTYDSADPDDFARQVARKRYHVQDAFYSEGFAKASGRKVLAFVFVVVESEYPYLASAVMLDEEARDQGRRLYERDLDTYARCVASGEWPAYGTSIQIVNLPRWALSE